LKIVEDTHEDLIKHFRADDFMMRPVIKEMVESMLYEARGRPTASQLCYKAQEIVEQAEKELLQCQPPRNLSQSFTTQSSELELDRILSRIPSYPKRPEVVSAPPPARSSSSYGDRSDPPSTVNAAELGSDSSKNNIRRDESRRASLGKNTAPLDPPGETHSHPRRISHGRREGSITSPSSPPASMTTTSSSNSDNNSQLPYMSTTQALLYILSKNEGMGDLVPREARKYLKDALEQRDHVSRPDGKMLHPLQ
jgi:hypothetical protein